MARTQPKATEINLSNFFIDDSPGKYQAPTALIKALEMAYALKRPLLLSGEPGTGKTDFAKWVAYTLSKTAGVKFSDSPLIYNTKSTSIAQDLFYFYDAVSHFRENNKFIHLDSFSTQKKDVSNSNAVQIKKSTDVASQAIRTTEDFIEFKALGLAFVQAIGSKAAEEKWPILKKKNIDEEPIGSVVLIDEIDKAPRDFPNDLLNEIERYEFEIREINEKIDLDKNQRERLVIILTSNYEKNLPEAFLRRCIYYHIAFPEIDELVTIVSERLNIKEDEIIKQVTNRIQDFLDLRKLNLQKRPSTSELIDFIRAVKDAGKLDKPLFSEKSKITEKSELFEFLPVLLKKREDLQLVNPQ